MPLTITGKKALKGFKKEYGIRGENVFYAYMKKYPKRTALWHKRM